MTRAIFCLYLGGWEWEGRDRQMSENRCQFAGAAICEYSTQRMIVVGVRDRERTFIGLQASFNDHTLTSFNDMRVSFTVNYLVSINV